MKILPLDKVRIGMKLAQNIYRYDSLLAFPKGITIEGFELNALRKYNIEYVLVLDSHQSIGKKDDINFTLDIIESVFKQNTLWNEEFGRQLYEKLEEKIIKNKKVMKYLNELRYLDSYSFAHCVNISVVIGVLLAINERVDEELTHLVYLTLLHDVGRIKMRKVFAKEGKLNEDEFRLLQKHPYFSFQLLKKAGFTEYELKFVQETHEKFDGSGYPSKLKGNEISNLAQLILIADVYNGLSSFRPYRRAYYPYEVVQIIKEERNKGFGPIYVDHFLENFIPYRVGTLVELNDGKFAKVKHLHTQAKTLPIVELVAEHGERKKTIDLAVKKDLRIKRIVQSY